MATDTKSSVTRRQALRRGAAAGAVIWTVPMVVSSTAHANSGSSASDLSGELNSLTCVWASSTRFFQPKKGTPSSPSVDLSGASFCEIKIGGRDWQVLTRDEPFTIRRGESLQMRPLTGGGGESAPLPDGESASTPTTTEVPAPETTVEAPPETTVPEVVEPAPDTTVAEVVEPTPDTTVAAPTPETTVAEVVEPAPESTVPVALPTVDASASVDTIVIDMSGRTDLNIGDVIGYFTIIDAEAA